MDNNKPVTPQSESETKAPAPPSPEGSNKMILWFVIGLAVIVLVAGGFYLLMARQQAGNTPVTKSPPPQVQDNLENDLQSLDVETGSESDFTTIDQDLQNL